MLPYMLMAIAGASSGYIADGLATRPGATLLGTRRRVNNYAFMTASFAMCLIPWAVEWWQALMLVCLALCAGTMTNGSFEANKLDIAGPHSIGLLQSMCNFVVSKRHMQS